MNLNPKKNTKQEKKNCDVFEKNTMLEIFNLNLKIKTFSERALRQQNSRGCILFSRFFFNF